MGSGVCVHPAHKQGCGRQNGEARFPCCALSAAFFFGFLWRILPQLRHLAAEFETPEAPLRSRRFPTSHTPPTPSTQRCTTPPRGLLWTRVSSSLPCVLRTMPFFQRATPIIMDRKTQWSLESLDEAGHGGPTCTWRLSLNSATGDALYGTNFGARTISRSHMRNRRVANEKHAVP